LFRISFFRFRIFFLCGLSVIVGFEINDNKAIRRFNKQIDYALGGEISLDAHTGDGGIEDHFIADEALNVGVVFSALTKISDFSQK
jgi:hypothetical protein